MRNEDTRLSKTVTLEADRVYLAELLERLSSQSGITLSIDERDTASGIHVTVHLADMPVGDMLNAIWSLTSTRDAFWAWRRSGQPGSYRYDLVKPLKAKDRATRLRQFTSQVLEGYVATMIALARLSPDERRRNKHRITEALNADTDEYADALLADEQTWNVIRLFADAVPRDIQRQVINGQRSAEIPVDNLTEQTKALFRSVWARYDVHISQGGGTLVPAPEPTLLKFYGSTGNYAIPEVVPSVFLDLGKGGSVSCLGGYFLEQGVRAAIRRAWMLGGDVLDHPASQKSIAEIQDEGKAIQESTSTLSPQHEGIIRPGRPVPPHAIDLRLAQAARGASLSLVATLPHQQGQDPGPPAHQTVQAFLSKLTKLHHPYPMYKWRGDILLVSYPEWFVEEDNDTPFGLIREYLHSADGLIALPNLAKLMVSISDGQARVLSAEYPAVRAALELRPLLLLYGQHPEIISSSGLRLDAERIASLRTLPRVATHPSVVNGTALALRISQVAMLTEGRNSLGIRVEVLEPDGKWSSLGGFLQIAPGANGPAKQ